MNLSYWKQQLSEKALRALNHERAQQILADERVQRAVSTAFEVGQQAKKELSQLKTQVTELVEQRAAGPAKDDTESLKRDLDGTTPTA